MLEKNMKIGLAGTGRMGTAMAQRLMGFGHELTVCRLDFENDGKPAITRIEAYPLFDGERESILRDVAAGIADRLQ